jgi:hypothetical protein
MFLFYNFVLPTCSLVFVAKPLHILFAEAGQAKGFCVKMEVVLALLLCLPPEAVFLIFLLVILSLIC